MSGAADWAAARRLLKILSPYTAVEDIPQGHDEWAAILEIADRGLVLPRLALRLREHSSKLPSSVIEHLDTSLELNRLRNQELRNQLIILLCSLNASGVVPVVIKGAVQLLDPHIDLGERIMLDMDIWTPDPNDQRITISCLQDLGYQMRGSMTDYQNSQHLPPFFLEGSLSRIELHHRMIDPHYASLVDEETAIASLRARSLHDAQYLQLDGASALKLSYIQCRWSCEDGHVTIMKWLDLLDRSRKAGLNEVAGPWDFGVRTNGDATDASFLTALSELCGLPYTGTVNARLIHRWQTAYEGSVAPRFFRMVLGNALDPSRWVNKRPSDVWRATVFRLSNMRNTFRRAKDRDQF